MGAVGAVGAVGARKELVDQDNVGSQAVLTNRVGADQSSQRRPRRPIAHPLEWGRLGPVGRVWTHDDPNAIKLARHFLKTCQDAALVPVANE